MKRQKRTMLRVGIYARRTVDSEKSDSIQMQIETCKKHIEAVRSGQIESITVYVDEGFTRRNTDRPDWQRMMNDIENGMLDLIVAYKIDRISGNMKDFAIFYTKIVDDYDMQLIAVREGIDSALPLVGEVMAYISALMASYEVKQDSIRSYDNARNLAVHGFWTGGKPSIGYQRFPITINGKTHKILDIVPEEVEFKMKLVNIFLENNFSLTAMEGYLKRNNIKTLRGSFYSTTQIYELLTSPHCVANTLEVYDYFESLGCQIEQEYSSRDKWDGQHGLIVFGRTTERKGKHVKTPPEDWLICIGRHKPFLSGETYLKIRQQLASHVFVKSGSHAPELLKGVLRCKCGCLMQISHKKKTDGSYGTWYYCLNRSRKGTEYCDIGHIKTSHLDEQVLNVFRNIQTDPFLIEQYIYRSDEQKKLISVDFLRKQEQSLIGKIEQLAASLALNSTSTAAKYIIAEIERLDQQLKDCQRQLLTATANERCEKNQRQILITKRQEICRLLDNFDNFTKEEKNAVAQSVLKECVWDGSTLKITL